MILETDSPVALPAVPTREQIETLQREISQHEQFQPETRHYFADGMYCREVLQPAGCLVVGKVHKKEHFFVLTKGRMTFWTEGGMLTECAPYVWVSGVGTKRALYSHEDSAYMTVHKVSSTDLEKVEAELVEDDPTSMFGVGNILKDKLLEVQEWHSLPQP